MSYTWLTVSNFTIVNNDIMLLAQKIPVVFSMFVIFAVDAW